MIEATIIKAFGINGKVITQKLSSGLINATYKIIDQHGKEFLLQKVNTQIFPKPKDIQNNYLKIQSHLANKNSIVLPSIIFTTTNEPLFNANNEVWRCFEYIKDTYSPATSTSVDEAWKVANCFGKFSALLSDLDPSNLSVVLPGFHDLELRFNQFETALKVASGERLKACRNLIDTAYQNKSLVVFYQTVVNDKQKFRLYILHHDCKIANILFTKDSNEIYCPIDLDTTQPGYYFSDLGDMVRSMTPNLSENDRNLDDLILRTDFYAAINDGYLQAMSQYLTKDELKYIDMAGKVITYMQAMRFLTDYLNNDVYYQIDYSEQNKNRAANQFRLLALLNDYTKRLSDINVSIA